MESLIYVQLQHLYKDCNFVNRVLCTCMYFYLMLNVNVNVHVYSPDIPVGSADCTIYTPGIGTHSFSLISSGENSAFAHFYCQL